MTKTVHKTLPGSGGGHGVGDLGGGGPGVGESRRWWGWGSRGGGGLWSKSGGAGGPGVVRVGV